LSDFAAFCNRSPRYFSSEPAFWVRAYYLHCCNRLFSLLSLITGVSAITVLLRISSFRDPEVPAGIRAFSTKKSPTTTVSYKSSPTIGVYLREIHEGAEAGICTVRAFPFGDFAFTAPNFQSTVRDLIFDLPYIYLYEIFHRVYPLCTT